MVVNKKHLLQAKQWLKAQWRGTHNISTGALHSPKLPWWARYKVQALVESSCIKWIWVNKRAQEAPSQWEVCFLWARNLSGVKGALVWKCGLTTFVLSSAQDANLLVAALSNKPEYLRNKQTDNNLVIDYRDWQIPLSRRFRSLATSCAVFIYGAKNSFHGISLHFWRRDSGTRRIVVNYVLHADLWSCGWCCVSMESQACNHTFENIVNSASILKDLCNLIHDLRFSHYDTDGLLHN